MDNREIIDNWLEGNDRFTHAPEPSVFYNVGDKVSFRYNYDLEVLEVIGDGKAYLLQRTNEDGTTRKFAKTWYQISPNEVKETNFRVKDDLHITFYNSTIGDLINKMHTTNVNHSPSYQRDYVWGAEDAEYLIESIFNNIDIGKFILNDFPYEEFKRTGFDYEVVDGKQRLRALLDFYESRVPYKGVYYNQLSMNDRSHFTSRLIQVSELRGATLEERVKLFVKLNTTGRVMDKDHINQVKQQFRV